MEVLGMCEAECGPFFAAGGFTTVVDMPLNSIPTTTRPEFLQAKVSAAWGPQT